MNGIVLKADIENYIAEARALHPEITDDMLYQGGEIYYMNGNDGTDFDWSVNNCTCEIMVFYKNEWGFLKVRAYKDGTIGGYIYLDEGKGRPIDLPSQRFDSKELAEVLYNSADLEHLYDCRLDDIDFENTRNYDNLDEDEDEEDW